MKKRILLLVLLCIQIQLLKAQKKNKPNVIVVLTDDQGYGDLACHGNPFLKTPAIDKLYNESVSLSNFHVDPTCAPTRAALMTGKYSAKVGTWMTFMGRHHISAKHKTMANIFAENGYQTAMYGKWHLGDNYPFRPQDRGFHESFIHKGGVIGETPDYWGNNYYDDTYFRNDIPEKAKGYCTDVWFENTKNFISKSAAAGKPFFVYLPLNAPHGPYHVPEKYSKPYKNNKNIPEKMADFYGMIASVDENIANLRDYLEDNKLSENTIFIYLSDNGSSGGIYQKVTQNGVHYTLHNKYGYNAGMRGKKGMAYEGGHRTIGMIHWPDGNLTTKKEVKTLTAHIDLLPTLMDLVALKGERDFDGESIKKLLYGEKTTHLASRSLVVHDQTVFGKDLSTDFPEKYKEFAVMYGKWRLVGKELYNLDKDPGQTHDVAINFPFVTNQMQRIYEDWWKDISKDFKNYNRTIVGSKSQKEIKLDAQFWHGNKAAYNQQHIRSAMKANGFWDLQVAHKGTYRFVLRRWPKELDKSMDSKVEAPQMIAGKHDIHFRLNQLESKRITPIKAKIKLGKIEKELAIQKGQKEVVFDIKLKKGPVNLKTWLIDIDGNEWGAYYVYITKNQN
ncbi:MAG: arylsulfatase [Flavicella sp.]